MKSIRNRKYWNELALIHADSKFYNLKATERGRSSLLPIERQLLGNLRGLNVLHLHCHLGQDSISMARTARHVTGVDYSARAVATARALASRCNQTNVDFIVCDVQKLSANVIGNRRYDVAVATYGVLMWVQDLDKWLKAISAQLKPNGRFVLVEEHPFAAVFSGRERSGRLVLETPYSCTKKPYVTNNRFSYAGDPVQLKNQLQYKWSHGLAKIFKELKRAGLQMQTFEEYHKCFYPMLPRMKKKRDGYWVLQANADSLPMMFSLVAKRARPE